MCDKLLSLSFKPTLSYSALWCLGQDPTNLVFSFVSWLLLGSSTEGCHRETRGLEVEEDIFCSCQHILCNTSPMVVVCHSGSSAFQVTVFPAIRETALLAISSSQFRIWTPQGPGSECLRLQYCPTTVPFSEILVPVSLGLFHKIPNFSNFNLVLLFSQRWVGICMIPQITRFCFFQISNTWLTIVHVKLSLLT